MTAPPDVVVHDVSHPSWRGVPVSPVQVVNNAAVRGGIGHLPAEQPRLHLGTAKEFFQLCLYFLYQNSLGKDIHAIMFEDALKVSPQFISKPIGAYRLDERYTKGKRC